MLYRRDWQRRLAVADDRDGSTQSPALFDQRRSNSLCRLLGTHRCQREAARRSACSLDFAHRHIETAALMARHGADVRPIDHDNDLRVVGALVRGSRQCRSRFALFDSTGYAVQAVAHADMVGRRAGHKRLEQPRRLAKRMSRAQVGV